LFFFFFFFYTLSRTFFHFPHKSVSPLCINEFINFQNIKAPHRKRLSPLSDKDEAIDKEDAYACYVF